ncbi:TonB-dependent receptor [Acidithiobacillus thiooxidans]|uniref:TonB-dependent receptor n=1 Tax=Acidithiobacillus thiooxidans TaxID=930 RepID=UPI002863448B|nr:TonB-dependent receptor [Acidithiobacillus thiooxidans]MDR7925788.1 TonB-dependent receptor [Acidithiobacillus thiooxidans]
MEKICKVHPPLKSIIAMSIMSALYCMPVLAYGSDAASTKNETEKKIVKIKKIKETYKKLILEEKNLPTTVTSISKKQILNSGPSQSIYSILSKAPSVSAYQQNIGPATPVFTVRGVRMSQIAQTLDGIPMQDLLSGGELAELAAPSGNFGSLVTTGQISGIKIYPGIAPPDKSGFATIGGTIAYTTKKPTKKFNAKLFSSIGSFGTESYGGQINSGSIPGTGGLRVLARLSQTQTDGYVEHTPARYTNFMISLMKPYDYGLSKITGLVIYNRSKGNFPYNGDAIPMAQQEKYGLFYNYPTSVAFNQEEDNDITAILGDDTYINRYLYLKVKGFYIGRKNKLSAYTNPDYINATYPYQVNMLSPYFNQGPIGVGSGGPDNDFSYDPAAVFGSYQAGEAAQNNISDFETVGVVPQLNIFLPDNTITLGGLIASENSTSSTYVYGTPNMPHINGYNSLYYNREAHREVYSGYAQDKISLLNGALTVEPGVTITEADTNSYVPENIFNSPVGGYSLSAINKSVQPYIGVSYKIVKHLHVYGSYGRGVRFAPAADYVIGTQPGSTSAPAAETVNAYQVGLRYETTRLYANIDGYWQNYNKLFGFVVNESTGYSQYSNVGRERGRGLEFSGEYKLTPNFNIYGNLSYNEQTYLNSFPAIDAPGESQSGFVYAGQPLPYAPDWLANLSLEYHRHNFQTTLSASYDGPSASIKDTGYSTNPELDGAGVPDTSSPVNGFFLMNLNARYKIPFNYEGIKNVTLGLNIDNILDRHYYVRTYKIYKFYNYNPVNTEYSAGIPGMPRFFDVSVTASF